MLSAARPALAATWETSAEMAESADSESTVN